MPQYKLYYFNCRVRGETIRMLFKLAGQEFEDVRIDEKEWPEFRKKTPTGLIPVLEIDGVQYCQSNAIARYLAKEYGYAGKDALAMCRVDMIIDCIEDIVAQGSPYWELPEDKQAAFSKKFKEEKLEPGLEKLETLLKQNSGGDGYFVGDELTFADLTFLNMGEYLAQVLGKTDLSKFPKLKALTERVESHPKIAAWIKERPVTDM